MIEIIAGFTKGFSLSLSCQALSHKLLYSEASFLASYFIFVQSSVGDNTHIIRKCGKSTLTVLHIQ